MLNVNDEVTATFFCPVLKRPMVINGTVIAIHDDVVCIRHTTVSTSYMITGIKDSWLARESVISSVSKI